MIRIQHFIPVVLAFLLVSCNAEKRLYRNGYYFERSKSVQNSTSLTETSRKKLLHDTESPEFVKCDDTVRTQKIIASDTAASVRDSSSQIIRETVIHQVADRAESIYDPPFLPDPKRIEEIHNARNTALISVILMAIGGVFLVLSIAFEVLALFMVGFVITSIAYCVAVYALIWVRRLVRKFPELKRNASGNDGELKSPYMTKPEEKKDGLSDMQVARRRALFYGWFTLLVGYLAMMIFAALLFAPA